MKVFELYNLLKQAKDAEEEIKGFIDKAKPEHAIPLNEMELTEYGNIIMNLRIFIEGMELT